MYKDSVADLKQSLIDENSLIPGSNINETAFMPMEEVLKGMYGLHFKTKKANDRVICESISAYSIYLKNISTVVERLFQPELACSDDNFKQMPNPIIYQKLCLPKFLTSHSTASKDLHPTEGMRKILVQIKH